MRRREFMWFAAGAAIAWPKIAVAQPADRARRIAVVMGMRAELLDLLLAPEGYDGQLS